MLRRLGKRKGFTLIEVLVAFVIFAIMAGMVGTILQTTMRVKQENTDNEENIELQKQEYYQKHMPASKDTYKSLSSDANAHQGNVDLNFYTPSGSSKDLSVKYVAAEVNSEAEVFELEYYVGQEGNEAWKDNDDDDDIDDDGGSGSVLRGLDAGIYGSAGIETVTVAVEPRNSEPNRYYVYVNVAAGDNAQDELANFSQIRIKFPYTILKYGYVNSIGTDNNDGTKYNCAADLAISGDLQTIRISGNGMDGDLGKSIFNLSSQKAVCWIELSSPLSSEQLSDVTKIFGDSGENSVYKDTASSVTTGHTLNRVKFNHYKSAQNEGKEYVNVFAAEEDEEDTSTEEAGE